MTLQGRVWAAQALQQAGLSGTAGPLERASSITNEVWYAGPWVVRVNVRPRRGTLKHEAEIAHLLPESVGYPEVVSYGAHDTAEWLVHRRGGGAGFCPGWPAVGGAGPGGGPPAPGPPPAGRRRCSQPGLAVVAGAGTAVGHAPAGRPAAGHPRGAVGPTAALPPRRQPRVPPPAAGVTGHRAAAAGRRPPTGRPRGHPRG